MAELIKFTYNLAGDTALHALWGLARVAIFHDIPEAYTALREALDDRRAEDASRSPI